MHNRNLLITLTATVSLFVSTAARSAEPLPPLTQLPEDWKITAHAPTLSALIAKEDPIIHTPDFTRGELLVWYAKDKRGRESFRLATARSFKPKSSPNLWILASGDLDPVNTENPLLPAFVVNVRKTRPNDDNGGMGTENWSRVVASDPSHGTVYEIEYYDQLAGECASGRLLVLFQDHKGAWQEIALLPGDYWSDTGWSEHTDVRVRWTNNPKSPIELTEIWRATNWTNEVPSDRAILHYGTDTTYTGPLPLNTSKSSPLFLIVRKNQTFSDILTQLALEDVDDEKLRPAYKAALKTTLLRLNPTLDPDHVRTGQKILVPNSNTRQKLVTMKP